MFMRRGCLFGCFGWLIACVALGVLGWFFLLPMFTESLEDGVADAISTVIVEEVDPFHSRSELQQGTDVRFSFSTINRTLRMSTEDENVDSIEVATANDEITIRADFRDQSFDVTFIPKVSADGELELDSVDDGGWWQRQFTGILSGGFEKSFNQWLDRNDLRLTDVRLEDEVLVLSVTGK